MAEDRDTEVTYAVPDFVAKLRRLADALESGTPFFIEHDGEEISIPEGAILSVAYEHEDGESEVEFQLSWSEETDEDDEDEEEDEDDEEPVEEEKA